jgi:hypothetical protein
MTCYINVLNIRNFNITKQYHKYLFSKSGHQLQVISINFHYDNSKCLLEYENKFLLKFRMNTFNSSRNAAVNVIITIYPRKGVSL